ncbi:MAG: endonuclease III [Sphaerochaetaceae bacterium]|nr:endonuclease III [Sphaerochaetaceae bacterium]
MIISVLDRISPREITFLEPHDPFQFLISVILSAQTTDASVNKVTPALFARYPDQRALAKADIEEVKAIIRPTGFYNTKARNIIAASQMLCERYPDSFPMTIEAISSLPGAGRKTANCVLGSVFGQSAIIVDTHFGRVVGRLMGPSYTLDPTALELKLKAEMNPKDTYRFSMTANLFGRTTCHARNPQCQSCPLSSLCCYFQEHSKA